MRTVFAMGTTAFGMGTTRYKPCDLLGRDKKRRANDVTETAAIAMVAVEPIVYRNMKSRDGRRIRQPVQKPSPLRTRAVRSERSSAKPPTECVQVQ